MADYRLLDVRISNPTEHLHQILRAFYDWTLDLPHLQPPPKPASRKGKKREYSQSPLVTSLSVVEELRVYS